MALHGHANQAVRRRQPLVLRDRGDGQREYRLGIRDQPSGPTQPSILSGMGSEYDASCSWQVRHVWFTSLVD